MCLIKGILLTVRWTPSHLLENPEKGVFSGISHLDILGNSQADKLADHAAVRACLPLNVTAPIQYYRKLAKRIQMRIATILLNLPHRPNPSKDKPNKPELPTLFLRGVLALKIHTKTTSKDRYLFWGCFGDQGDQKGV